MSETQAEYEVTVVDNTPAALIQNAVNMGTDLEKLEKLMVLQERYEANEARKLYHKSMAAFKSNPPKITKDKTVSYKATQYSHASLANVTSTIGIELSKHGLSASWTTEQNGAVTVTCKITHEAGHSEQTSLTAQADTSGSKNSIQAIGSSITYLERYTLLALTGLATHDQDDDGKDGGIEYITTDMQTEINDLIKSTKADKVKVLKYLQADSVETIPLSSYGKAIVAFKAKSEEGEK